MSEQESGVIVPWSQMSLPNHVFERMIVLRPGALAAPMIGAEAGSLLQGQMLGQRRQNGKESAPHRLA